MRLLLGLISASSSLALVTAAFVVGCSGAVADAPGTGTGTDAGGTGTGTGADGGTGGDASHTDGGGPVGTDSGTVDPIWPADAQKLVADSPGGGFTPMPPAGSACSYGAQKYTVDLATKAFAFERCTAGATATDPLVLAKGGRTLTSTELATVDAAMKKLTPPKDPKLCGADKGVYTVTVTSPRGDATFYDSFYACNGGGKTYVDNIDGVFEAFRLLAPM
jgi:hypothetical protein